MGDSPVIDMSIGTYQSVCTPKYAVNFVQPATLHHHRANCPRLRGSRDAGSHHSVHCGSGWP